MRAKRQALSSVQQQNHAEKALQLWQQNEQFSDLQKVAFYMACDGELQPLEIASTLLQKGKQCYLPVVPQSEQDVLSFVPWYEDSVLMPNRFNIPEPKCFPHEKVNADTLDAVLMPLVGFDKHGQRLGMGEGFYDKTFAEMFKWDQRPRLIGLAHELQYLPEGIPVDTWDIPMDIVITEKKIYIF